MNIEEKKVSRRKLVGWLGVLSLFAAAGSAFKPWTKKTVAEAPKPKTVKMLTPDGKLVEVDVSKLASTRTRISDHELRNFVSKKQS